MLQLKGIRTNKEAFYQFGSETKYHYKSGNARSREIARKKAGKQSKAVFAKIKATAI